MSEAPIDIPAARHERTDIGERLIWIASGAVLGVLTLCGLLVFWLYPQSRLDRTLTLPLALYPAPRLQPSPPKELQALRTAQLRRLESSGWVDKPRGVVHLPISEAMRIVAHEGIAEWPHDSNPPAAGAGGQSP
jgi:hypothetical protein